MICPRFVYVILIYDNSGLIPEGVYVGSSHNVKQRIDIHKNDRCTDSQRLFHELMRQRRYEVWVVDEISSIQESHLEYDWIDFFSKNTLFEVFNVRKNQLNADWHRLEGRKEFAKWNRYAFTMC